MGAVVLGAAGCAIQVDPNQQAQPSDKLILSDSNSKLPVEPVGAPTTTRADAPQHDSLVSAEAPTSAVPESVTRLFDSMDAAGEGTSAVYERELRSFLASDQPLAALERTYLQLPASATGDRWKTVYAAAQIESPEAISFLERVGLGPEELVTSTGDGHGGDQSFKIRYAASIGVARGYIKNVAGSAVAVEHLLTSANPDVAQLVGLELFGEGKLTAPWRDVMIARGIPANFRRLAGTELDELRTLHPENDRRPGAKARQQLPAPVPAYLGSNQ